MLFCSYMDRYLSLFSVAEYFQGFSIFPGSDCQCGKDGYLGFYSLLMVCTHANFVSATTTSI